MTRDEESWPSARSLAPLGVGYAMFLSLVAWLTWGAGGANLVVLVFLLAVGLVYVFVRVAPFFSDASRENITFAVAVVGLLGLLGVLSGWSWNYLVFVTTTALIFALFALGLNLEYGYTGIINFGHVAFMGIGAYVTTLGSIALLPRVDVLTGSLAWGLGLVGVAGVIVFGLVAMLASVLAEVLVDRFGGGLEQGAARAVSLAAGGVVGAVAALAVVWGVSVPLSSSTAVAFVVAGSVLAGMLVAALVGVLLGLPTLRLREDYLAIVTIGFAEILRRAWLNEAWLTGGSQGLRGFPLPFRGVVGEWAWLTGLSGWLGAGSTYRVFMLLLVMGALALVYALYELLVRSPYGRVLKAIREDEEVASALGKNVFAYKLQALALGSAVAALAGAFLAWHRVFISPRTFLPLFTFYAWIIIVIGGLGNNKGTILGALFLYTIFESTRALNLDAMLGFSSSQAAAFRVVIIGVLLIVVMMFKPEGILGRREEMVLGD